MAAACFLDTNILLRYFTSSDPDKALRAKALLKRVERRDEQVVPQPRSCSKLSSRSSGPVRCPRSGSGRCSETCYPCPVSGWPGQGLCLQALALYVAHNISFADAYTAAYMESLKLSEIYTWDADFDRLPGISRLQPAEEAGNRA